VSNYIESYYPETKIADRLILKVGDTLKLTSGSYKVGKIYGKGGFGSVYKIVSSKVLNETKAYALKIYDFWRIAFGEYQEIRQKFSDGFEIGLINSDFIVKHFYKGQLFGNPYIIMQNCEEGCLKPESNEFISPLKYNLLANQILLGLGALHNNGVIHRDIKPENILFNEDGVAHLVDYDISGRIKEDLRKDRMLESDVTISRRIKNQLFKTASKLGASRFVGTNNVWGTLEYAPPEQLDHLLTYRFMGPKTDIYSFGITMYESISGGNLPYGRLKDYQSISDFRKGVYRKLHYRPLRNRNSNVDKNWSNTIEACIEPNEENRPNDINEIIQLLKLNKRLTKPKQKQFGIPVLMVKSGAKYNERYKLPDFIKNNNSKSIKIGRFDTESSIKNQISFPENLHYTSRKQATLNFSNGIWTIKDGQYNEYDKWQFSANGTYINGELLLESKETKLSPGDLISIGDVTLMFTYL